MTTTKRWYSREAAALCTLVRATDPVTAIRQLVDDLLDEAEVTAPPAPVDLLASFRRVHKIATLDMTQDGRLVPDGSGYIIHVNQRHSPGKRRFTIGHETCHTFVKSALASRTVSWACESGLFNIEQEEEYLCDVGAGRMIFHPQWFLSMAQAHRPSIAGIVAIARDCGASIEACAFQLTASRLWPCTFVFWEPGLRKAQRVLTTQAAFDGWDDIARPQQLLRVTRVYSTDGLPLLPPNKSAPADTQIHRAWAAQTATAGEEVIDCGKQLLVASCQSEYMPYRDSTGALRPRVVSCLLWKDLGATASTGGPGLFC